MKYIGVADVRNPHADAWGHGGISCRPIPIYRGLANDTNAFICPLANTKWADIPKSVQIRLTGTA